MSSSSPSISNRSIPPSRPRGRLILAAFLGVLVVAILALGLQVGPGGSIPTAHDLIRVAGGALVASGWILAAFAIGTGLWRLLPRTRTALDHSIAVRCGIGIAALVWLDLLLGSLGLLGRDHQWLGILVLAVPIVAWLADRLRSASDATRSCDPPAVLIPLALPLAVLLVAAASVPGWLWTSEFGGFDALSYHLQVPREWWYANGIVELPHNAYAYLPGAVSAAFLHLMTVVGDPTSAAIACQMLVAGATVVAMIATGELVLELGVAASSERPRVAAPLLGALLLVSTPWVVVVGSLAYDEAFVLALGTAAVILILRLGRSTAAPEATTPGDLAAGIVLGLLLGGTVVAKASSIVLVVLPIALGAAIAIPPRRWLPVVAGTAIGGVLICLPWLVRNVAWTGNPVFPLATDLLGLHDWSAAQGERFDAAHRSVGPQAGLVAILHEYVLDDLIVALPPGEPRRPQWWWLPGLGLLASMFLLLRPTPDRTARRRAVVVFVVLLATILAWAFLTHAKARFLLPTAPLLAAAIASLASPLFHRRSGTIVLLVAAWLVSFGPVIHALRDRDGGFAWGITAQEAFDGRLESRLIENADPATAASLLREASLAAVLRTLPPESRTLLVGVATPFHLPMEGPDGSTDRIAYTTVWTRGPLERAFARVGGSPSDPVEVDRIVRELRDRGVTHLVIAPTMLEVWSRSGWLDPELTPDRLAALIQGPGIDIVHRFPDGGVLLSLDTDA